MGIELKRGVSASKPRQGILLELCIDEYRRGWCLRYLREAKADLDMAGATEISHLAKSMCVAAMRKSQTAVYYALGDPDYIGNLVRMAVDGMKPLVDPVIRFLASLEKTVQALTLRIPEMEVVDVVARVSHIVEVSRGFVELYLGLDFGVLVHP